MIRNGIYRNETQLRYQRRHYRRLRLHGSFRQRKIGHQYEYLMMSKLLMPIMAAGSHFGPPWSPSSQITYCGNDVHGGLPDAVTSLRLLRDFVAAEAAILQLGDDLKHRVEPRPLHLLSCCSQPQIFPRISTTLALIRPEFGSARRHCFTQCFQASR